MLTPFCLPLKQEAHRCIQQLGQQQASQQPSTQDTNTQIRLNSEQISFASNTITDIQEKQIQHLSQLLPNTTQLQTNTLQPAMTVTTEYSADAGSSNTSLDESSPELLFESVIHSYQCTDDNCALPDCHKMKIVVQHKQSCKTTSI